MINSQWFLNSNKKQSQILIFTFYICIFLIPQWKSWFSTLTFLSHNKHKIVSETQQPITLSTINLLSKVLCNTLILRYSLLRVYSLIFSIFSMTLTYLSQRQWSCRTFTLWICLFFFVYYLICSSSSCISHKLKVPLKAWWLHFFEQYLRKANASQTSIL